MHNISSSDWCSSAWYIHVGGDVHSVSTIVPLFLIITRAVLSVQQTLCLSVSSPGQILGTRWDLTLPPPTATPTLTWRSSYDNDDCLNCPSLTPPSLPQAVHVSFLPFFHPRLPLFQNLFFEWGFHPVYVMRRMKESEGMGWLNDWIGGGSHYKNKKEELGVGFRELGLTLR